MRITKDKFQSWEGDIDYDVNYDDELIILLEPNQTALAMSDYILMIQEKADKYDKLINGNLSDSSQSS